LKRKLKLLTIHQLLNSRCNYGRKKFTCRDCKIVRENKCPIFVDDAYKMPNFGVMSDDQITATIYSVVDVIGCKFNKVS